VIELFFVRERVDDGARVEKTERIAGFRDAHDLIARRGDAGFGLFDQERPECETDRDGTDRDDDDDQQRVRRRDARAERKANL
jgi:hypothetical protein